MDKFKVLGLNPNLLKGLKEMGFSEPTEIQEKVIPLALAGDDVIGESATGSGKTLAFGVPIIDKVKVAGGLQALVLTPTRELAEQISKSIKSFAKYNPLKIITVYGGVAIGPQIDGLERAEVVVGTPGRILDHISRKTINLSKIKILVLDEADRMFDMGFIHDVTDIVHLCPKNRQTLLFSATISDEIAKISKRYMNEPKEVSAEHNVDPTKLTQFFYDVPSNQKFSLLVHLLREENSKLVMIFCNTKRNADLVSGNLRKQGFDAEALHGDLNQAKRTRILEHFHRSEKFILVCTDVAARGLDIKGVSHVYNYEFPKTEDEYTHRIGRTARAGKDGKAITILAERDYENFRKANRYDNLKIKKLELPKFETVFVQMNDRSERGERGGRSFGGTRSFSGGQGGYSGGRRAGGFHSRSGGSSGFSRGSSNSGRSFGNRDSRSSGSSEGSSYGRSAGGSSGGNFSRGRSGGSGSEGRSGGSGSGGGSYGRSAGGSSYGRSSHSSSREDSHGRGRNEGSSRGGNRFGRSSSKPGQSRGRSGGHGGGSRPSRSGGSSFKRRN